MNRDPLYDRIVNFINDIKNRNINPNEQEKTPAMYENFISIDFDDSFCFTYNDYFGATIYNWTIINYIHHYLFYATSGFFPNDYSELFINEMPNFINLIKDIFTNNYNNIRHDLIFKYVYHNMMSIVMDFINNNNLYYLFGDVEDYADIFNIKNTILTNELPELYFIERVIERINFISDKLTGENIYKINLKLN